MRASRPLPPTPPSDDDNDAVPVAAPEARGPRREDVAVDDELRQLVKDVHRELTAMMRERRTDQHEVERLAGKLSACRDNSKDRVLASYLAAADALTAEVRERGDEASERSEEDRKKKEAEEEALADPLAQVAAQREELRLAAQREAQEREEENQRAASAAEERKKGAMAAQLQHWQREAERKKREEEERAARQEAEIARAERQQIKFGAALEQRQDYGAAAAGTTGQSVLAQQLRQLSPRKEAPSRTEARKSPRGK